MMNSGGSTVVLTHSGGQKVRGTFSDVEQSQTAVDERHTEDGRMKPL